MFNCHIYSMESESSFSAIPRGLRKQNCWRHPGAKAWEKVTRFFVHVAKQNYTH
jgi:hypothetical protein